MITCEICGTQADQHDHWRHEIMARVAALEDVVGGDKTDERLAKLEECARTAWEVGKPAPFATPTVQHSGAIVKDEPPAGQPSRQETGGDCGVPGCRACTAMRDRAKAKEAEQATCSTCIMSVLHADGSEVALHPNHSPAKPPAPAAGTLSEEAALMAKAAEPSAPAAGTLSEELQSILDAVTRGAMRPVGGEPPTYRLADAIRRAKDEETNCAALNAKLAQAERERDEWRPRYEAAAADARTLREAWARAERERDEATAKLANWQKFQAGERDRWEAMLKRSHDAAENRVANGRYEADKREAEATARERERCLAWFSQWETTGMTRDYRDAGIRSGKPAPGTGAPAPKCDPDPPREVAPDRTQAEDCARCPVCRWPLAETVDKGCVPGNCSYRPRERGNP